MKARVVDLPVISCQKPNLVGGFAILYQCWSGGWNGSRSK